MTILHISNGYAVSKVHENLVREISTNPGLNQIVYCPVRSGKHMNANRFEADNVDFYFANIIKPWHKISYNLKRFSLFQDLCCRVNMDSVNIIHAGTLFSDGVLAYMAWKKYKIPYVVAVRSVDIVFFAKRLPHTWPIAKKILINAKKIYFISVSLQEEFKTLWFVRKLIPFIEAKFVLRPNGIENFWHENIIYDKLNVSDNILFIGKLNQNKNLVRLIDAIKDLRKIDKYKCLKLTVVGYGNYLPAKNAVEHNRDFVDYKGKIIDKLQLVEIMRKSCLFAMPSIRETFGLVYLEALSQNLPVLYTKGQGIDGMFTDNDYPVGVSVNAKSVDDIKSGLKTMLENPFVFTNSQVQFTRFEWKRIADSYINDYSVCCDNCADKH